MTLITLHDNSENHLPSMVDADQVIGVQRECWSAATLESDTFIVKTTVGDFEACWDDVIKLFEETGTPTVLLQEFHEKDFEISVRDDVYGDRENYGRKFTQEQLINNARGMLQYLTAEPSHLVTTEFSKTGVERNPVYPELYKRISKSESVFRHLPSTTDMLIEAVPDAALVDNWTWNDETANILLHLHDERCKEGHFPGFKVDDETKNYHGWLKLFEGLIKDVANVIKERSK